MSKEKADRSAIAQQTVFARVSVPTPFVSDRAVPKACAPPGETHG